MPRVCFCMFKVLSKVSNISEIKMHLRDRISESITPTKSGALSNPFMQNSIAIWLISPKTDYMGNIHENRHQVKNFVFIFFSKNI